MPEDPRKSTKRVCCSTASTGTHQWAHSLMWQCMKRVKKEMSNRSFQASGQRQVRKAIARSFSIRPIYLARWVFIAAAGCPLPGYEFHTLRMRGKGSLLSTRPVNADSQLRRFGAKPTGQITALSTIWSKQQRLQHKRGQGLDRVRVAQHVAPEARMRAFQGERQRH